MKVFESDKTNEETSNNDNRQSPLFDDHEIIPERHRRPSGGFTVRKCYFSPIQCRLPIYRSIKEQQ